MVSMRFFAQIFYTWEGILPLITLPLFEIELQFWTTNGSQLFIILRFLVCPVSLIFFTSYILKINYLLEIEFISINVY